MLKLIKNNKTLSIIIFLSVISITIGLILPSILDKEIKDTITNNILVLVNNYKNNTAYSSQNIKSVLFGDVSLIIIIWLLGISIIGIPILLFLYLSKLVLFSLEFIFLLLNIKYSSLIFIVLYLIPFIIYLIILFFLVYYATSYSIILTKLLFFKKDYNIKTITKKYFKILVISFASTIIYQIINIVIIPKIIYFFIG